MPRYHYEIQLMTTYTGIVEADDEDMAKEFIIDDDPITYGPEDGDSMEDISVMGVWIHGEVDDDA